MEYDLKDKVVVLTGGAVGIGKKVIEFMLEEEVKHVAFLDIAEDNGVALQEDMNKKFGNNKIRYYKCNVLEEHQVFGNIQSVIEEFGYIDVFVNNAGIMNDSLTHYKTEIQLNVTTLVTCTLKALEWMRTDKGGKGGVIINISSIAALMQSASLPIYFATKSAVLQFSNCIGRPEYYSRTGVRVIAICFGATDTALLSRRLVGSFDTLIDDSIIDAIKKVPVQTVESAAKGLLEACKRGDSGSTWLACADKPVKDISEAVKQAYRILSDSFLSD